MKRIYNNWIKQSRVFGFVSAILEVTFFGIMAIAWVVGMGILIELICNMAGNL